MEGRSSPSRRVVVALVVAAVAFAAGAAVVLVLQVEVSSQVGVSSEVEVSGESTVRACGSALDGLVDRVGWEDWWAADLTDTDAVFLRTTECPGALNARLLAAGLLAALAAGSILAAFVVARLARPTAPGDRHRLVRLGRATAWAGVGLTVAGAAAIVVLVADADSTLFLYTDRLVVAVVGLIVLVPAVALAVLGRALVLVATDPVGERRPGADAAVPVPELDDG